MRILPSATTPLTNGLLHSFLIVLATLFLGMRFRIVAIAVAGVLPVATLVAVQCVQGKGIRPDPGHLFIDVLAEVGYIKNAAPLFRWA